MTFLTKLGNDQRDLTDVLLTGLLRPLRASSQALISESRGRERGFHLLPAAQESAAQESTDLESTEALGYSVIGRVEPARLAELISAATAIELQERRSRRHLRVVSDRDGPDAA